MLINLGGRWSKYFAKQRQSVSLVGHSTGPHVQWSTGHFEKLRTEPMDTELRSCVKTEVAVFFFFFR